MVGVIGLQEAIDMEIDEALTAFAEDDAEPNTAILTEFPEAA